MEKTSPLQELIQMVSHQILLSAMGRCCQSVVKKDVTNVIIFLCKRCFLNFHPNITDGNMIATHLARVPSGARNSSDLKW